MSMKSFLLACGLLTTGMLSAATPTLNVDLTVTHGIYAENEIARTRNVVFLVLDRSGSMNEESLPGGRTPNEALVESLTKQLAAIRQGTEVRVVPFSSTIWNVQVYKRLDDKARNAIVNFVKKEKPNGMTLRYDAEDLALSEAAKIMDGDANAEVRVLVYTDGGHQTPPDYEGEYKACYHNRVKKGIGRSRLEINPNYQNDQEAAKQKFDSRFEGLFARPNLDVEYEWLSATPKPEAQMTTKTTLPTEFASQTANLANPLANPEQTVKGVLRLPISDKCWGEIKGKPISLDFEVDGKHVTEVFTLEEGRRTCKLAWPILPTDRPATAKISLSRLPAGEKFELKEPKPLQWRVPAQGRVSVEVTSPAKDAVVAVGSKVNFMAKASDQADVKWTIGPAKKLLTGASVNWVAETAGTVSYDVVASKSGFKSATALGTLEVIPTGVEVLSTDSRFEVGKESVFQAKAVGPCLRYVWSVDGRRVSGEGDVLKHAFEKSGDHQIGVTAFYKNNLQADSAPKAVSVAKAPFVEILAPAAFDGDVENVALQAEKPIDLAARVEGGLTEVVWLFKLKDKVIASLPTTVKDGRVAGRYTPPKGGYYDVIATGKGPAGEKSGSVQIFVKSAEIRVGITKPKPNQDVDTGKEFVLEAVVKGPVKSVRWKMTDRSTAKPVPFGESVESAVVDGKTTMTAKLPLELGNASVEIVAEPVLADQELADTVAPGVVVVAARTAAEISYTPETLALNWKKVKYGEQAKLAVTTSGAIKKVAWFTCDASGKEVSLGKEGSTVNVDVSAVRGQSERHIDYFAKGLMPDGKWIPVSEPERITIVGYCECGIRGILLPKGTDGVPRSRFRIGEKFSVALDLAPGAKKPSVVAWSFGDGGRASGLSAEHAYSKDGTNLVVCVNARCPSCDKQFSETATVACGVVPPRADFEIRNYSGSATCGSQIELDASKCEGDVADYIWTVDGEELKEYRGKKTAYAKCGSRPSDLSVCLTVAAPKGYQPEVPSCKRVVRVRFGWWAAVPAVLVLVLLVYVAGRLLFGNSPRKWKFYSKEGPAPKPVKGNYPDELDVDYHTMWSELTGVHKWNFWTKRGRIRLADMLMLDDCGEGGNVWQPLGEEEFEVRCKDGIPTVQPPTGKFNDVTAEVNPNDLGNVIDPYSLFQYAGISYADEIADGHGYLRVRIDTQEARNLFHAFLFLVVFGLLVWGFVEFCLRYAI